MRRSEGTSDPPLWEQPLQGMNGSGFGADVEAFGGGFFDRVTGVGSSRDSYDTVEVQDCQSQLRACIQRISDVEAIQAMLEGLNGLDAVFVSAGLVRIIMDDA